MSVILITLAALIFIVVWIYLENIRIDKTKYDVYNSSIPEAFEGYRIVQISDLHNDTFGSDNRELISAVRKEKPDVIFITGDYIDSRRTNVQTAVSLTKELVRIAPVYYVTGNHEGRVPEEFEKLTTEMQSCGVTILRNQGCRLEHNGAQINLIGIDDTDFICNYKVSFELTKEAGEQIEKIERDEDYTILLAHRPELLDVYASEGIDLVFSGHAHGGQFRVPFVGALYTPIEGWFPKHSEGLLTKGKTDMIVSRGLGQSIFPFRINNSPELVTAVLHSRK